MKNIKMATDLFGQYYNNPTKSYLYTQMTCNGSSADEISFDIVNGKGVISNNENDLASIDLSDVHVGLTQYTNDMKTIDPHQIIYIKGIDKGMSYTTKVYGKISDYILENENWMYEYAVVLYIKYLNSNGIKVVRGIVGCGSKETDTTLIESLQDAFDAYKIPITVSHEDGYIKFSSTTLGYDFWMSFIELWYITNSKDTPDLADALNNIEQDNVHGFGYDNNWMKMKFNGEHPISNGNAYESFLSETDYRNLYDYLISNSGLSDVHVSRIFLFEDLSQYVSAYKYRNGAMKGCIIKATYPVFNAENIKDTMHSLKLVHLTDRIADYIPSVNNEFGGVPIYTRVIRDVVDSYFSQYEYDLYNKWCLDYKKHSELTDWINPEDIPFITNINSNWNHSFAPEYYVLNSIYKFASKYDAVGLYGYANYATKNNLWMNIGQFYARTAVDDDESTNSRNLIPSLIIYNPNDFPVSVNYITFA